MVNTEFIWIQHQNELIQRYLACPTYYRASLICASHHIMIQFPVLNTLVNILVINKLISLRLHISLLVCFYIIVLCHCYLWFILHTYLWFILHTKTSCMKERKCMRLMLSIWYNSFAFLSCQKILWGRGWL